MKLLKLVVSKSFVASCFMLAIYFCGTQIIDYAKNEDTSTITFTAYNTEIKDKYVTFAICYDPVDESRYPAMFDEKVVRENLGIDPNTYYKILHGEANGTSLISKDIFSHKNSTYALAYSSEDGVIFKSSK